MAWVAWDKVTCDKEEGGLGLARLDECNKALILKWCWRYFTEQNALWRKVIDSIHGSDRKWGALPINTNVSGVWKNIATLCGKIKVEGSGVMNMIRGRVGNGKDIRFWIDPWLCQLPLKECYPDLFGLETQKQCRVYDRCELSEDNYVIKWRWKRVLVTLEEIAHREDLEARLAEASFSDQKDRWCWNDKKTDSFTVASAKRWLRGKGNEERFDFKWSKWVPAKCNIFM
ncbi:hypothetical protein HanIR_Chr16g0843241 [Helianthus annuus]|nr:hypothetical protein HanIR_Chr16g0843241 [Helianthus annuus]